MNPFVESNIIAVLVGGFVTGFALAVVYSVVVELAKVSK